MKLDDSEIARLLQLLHSDLAHRRKTAADGLAALSVKSDEVVHALETVAAQDSNEYVRQAALRALERDIPVEDVTAPGVTASPPKSSRHVYKTRQEQWLDFALGFVGWFVVNGVLAFALGRLVTASGYLYGPWSPFPIGGTFCIWPVIFFVNIVVLLVVAFKRGMVALGILGAYAVNLMICLVKQVGLYSFCGAPFFFDVFAPYRY